MLKKLLISIVIVIASSYVAYSQSGTLKGKVTDKDTKEGVPFANVIIEAGGKQLGGTSTDFDGNFTIKPIPPGKYDVKISHIEYHPKQINGVIINADKITFLKDEDCQLVSKVVDLKVVEIVDYKVPLISKDETSSGATMTAEEIAKMPGRTASSVVATVGGVYQKDGEVNIRGARSEGTIMYIDGVRVRGSSSLPASAIEQITVITGGTPAQYGDATGGVINITTKGPSRTWGGGLEILTSELFDSYGYNLLGFNVQGPLIKIRDKKDTTKKTSLFGFFLSGELKSIKDNNPTYLGFYRVKKEILDSLKAHPYRPTGRGFGVFQNSEFIRKSDLEHIKARDHAYQRGINLSAKIDVKTPLNSNFTIGGTFNYDYARLWSYSNMLFNSENNGEGFFTTYRIFGRFTQRFNTTFSSDTSKNKKDQLIKNVYYTIQADYTKYLQLQQDVNHKDRLFDYGYIGKFKTHFRKGFERGKDEVTGYDNIWVHNGPLYYYYEFIPDSTPVNPVLANYTKQYYSMYPKDYHVRYDVVQAGGGLLNGDAPNSVYGIWANAGTVYNNYSKINNSQISFNAMASADVKNHAVSLGFLYEQRDDRAYRIAPYSLWTLARQLTNKHIVQLDKANPYLVYYNGVYHYSVAPDPNDPSNPFLDTIFYDRLYSKEEQSFFDYNLRKKLNMPVDGKTDDDWIDIDNIDRSILSVDMFNADELYNGGGPSQTFVSYYGYDHTGKLLDHKPSFDDFFTAKDEYGNYKREIAPFQPIYIAGWIQDKFAFNDLIFNIGLRVDRFDANQKALKDNFLLFPTKTVAEVTNFTHPSNVGPDYYVYVDDVQNPTKIKGYRKGFTWYNAQGDVIEDPRLIEGEKGIAPYLVDPNDITVSSKAFKDYEPQTTFMPRISFSFPISDEALFYAHYDVLTKRPTDGLRLNPTHFFFINAMGNSILCNPNLKPEKTIDYELGFQQKLTNSSSLKLSAYYKEQRDMLQLYRFVDAYPVTYSSWNNIDFGTVKGLTVTYDLRRTKNVWLKASYTLQFADGTGSSSTSGINLINSGQPNLRILNPLDFDRRHAISAVIDFRYGEGKEYNGPKLTRKIKGTDKIKTIQLLANTGINFTFTGGSGTPYTKYAMISSAILGNQKTIIEGMINGSRLPWQFQIDARIDRDFYFKLGKKSDGEKREAYINVYLQILNVLNTKNIEYVYQATGSPDDDGYLTAAEFQKDIASQTDERSFRDLYSIAINNPYNYSMPRIVRLGIQFNF